MKLPIFVCAILFAQATNAQLLLNALEDKKNTIGTKSMSQGFSYKEKLNQTDFKIDSFKQQNKTISSGDLKNKIQASYVAIKSILKKNKSSIRLKQNEKIIRDIEKNKVEYNKYIDLELQNLEENDKIIFINNAKIDNVINLIDSLSNKSLDERTKIIEGLIDLKYASKKRYDLFKEQRDKLEITKSKIEILNNFETYLSDSDNINNAVIEKIKEIEISKAGYDSLKTKFLKSHESVKAEVDKFFADNVVKKTAELSKDDALKISNNFLNDLILTPTITLLGSNNNTRKNVYRETGLSIGVVSDKVAQNNLSFFYADLSTFKVNAGFNFYLQKMADTAYIKTDDRGIIGFNFDLSFLGKKYFTDTTKFKESFNTTAFFLKTGIEIVLIDQILSGYSNIKAFAPVSGFEPFRDFKQTNNTLYSTIDFGFNFLLNPKEKGNGFNILLNLNFLINNNDVKVFTKYDGFLVPSVKIGFSKSLNVFGKKATRNDIR
jgi:hypothetical protein